MNKSRLLLLPLFLYTLFAVSCKKLDKEEKIPSFIYIDEVVFNANFATEGSNSHNISEVKVYVNDELMGFYELPAEIPILEEGVRDITIYPGIRNNGLSSTRFVYPLMNPYEETVNLKKDEAITIKPTFTYKSINKFSFIESFEDQGSIFIKHSQSDTNLVVTGDNENVFEGSGSGIINMDTSDFYFRIQTDQSYILPGAGVPVYLEMDYACNQPLVVSLLAETPSIGTSFNHPVITLNPTYEGTTPVWNKIYLDLTFLVSFEAVSGTESFEIVLEGFNFDGSANSTMNMDNLKLVHF